MRLRDMRGDGRERGKTKGTQSESESTTKQKTDEDEMDDTCRGARPGIRTSRARDVRRADARRASDHGDIDDQVARRNAGRTTTRRS